MCGRFVSRDQAAIERYFSLGGPRWRLVVTADEPIQAQYNVAPTSMIAIVRFRGSAPELTRAHWGLVPHWAEDRRSGARMINARAETVAQRRAFATPIRKWRCLIPALGWYEWRKENGTRQPYYIYADDGLTFAGILAWNGRLSLLSCSIITTEANRFAREIGDRMPAVLSPQAWDTWMDAESDLDDVLGLLRPYEGNELRMRKVSQYVNDARNEGPQCIEALG